jgi:hypothetical protein
VTQNQVLSPRNQALSNRLVWRLVALLAILFAGSHLAHASNYSCGTPISGHCYGVTQWQEQPVYYGSYTDLLQIAMNCPSNCGGFINNEMWLVDYRTQACLSNGFGACWVEAGFHAFSGEGNPYYFWADSRPLSSSAYNNHFLNQADSADFEHVMLLQDGRGAAGTFQVWIYNTSLSVLFNGTSTSNNMSPNTVIIGTELAGSTGASALPSQFQRNLWAVKPLGPEYVFWANVENDEGNLTSQNPPTASWLIDPALSGAPQGGLFTTSCCN